MYGLEWGEEEIKYFVDGVVVRTVENKHWHQPLYVIVDSATMPNWFGMPDDEDLPSTFIKGSIPQVGKHARQTKSTALTLMGEGRLNSGTSQLDRRHNRLPPSHALPGRANLAGPVKHTDRKSPRKAQTKNGLQTVSQKTNPATLVELAENKGFRIKQQKNPGNVTPSFCDSNQHRQAFEKRVISLLR